MSSRTQEWLLENKFSTPVGILKMREKLSKLFPTTRSFVIFISYIVVCVSQGILINASSKKRNYNIVTVVLLTETLKLFITYFCYIKDNSLSSLWQEIRSNVKTLCLYLVPSFLYCIYNNLVLINLSHFDPTTYFILLQLRVVSTGIIYQIIFHKKLSKMQWFSLGLLTCGCMTQCMNWDYVKATLFGGGEDLKNESFFSIYLLFMIIQNLCSSFAGVYNELLLKETSGNVNLFIQNIFMYVDSIFWNMVVLFFQGSLTSVLTWEALEPIFQTEVLLIIFNNALIGISASFFLKNLDSILKIFASAMEPLLTAFLSWLILDIQITFNTIVAIMIISFSFYIYFKNPINSQRSKTEITVTGEKVSHDDVV